MHPPLKLLLVLVGLSRVEGEYAPPQIQVLSPSEFNILLPQQENGYLMVARAAINDRIRFLEDDSHYKRQNAKNRVINFSENALNLTKGDKISYSTFFANGDGRMHGDSGDYTFDGVYKSPDRRRREIYEYLIEGSPEVSNLNQDQVFRGPDHYRLPRYEHGHGHEAPHFHGPPHGHHGPHHFGIPPHAAPRDPVLPGPGPWRGNGHGHGDHFGNNGPWEGHNHDEDCDSKYPGGHQRPGNNKPWGGGDNDNPYQGNGNDNKNDGFDNPYGDKKPGKGNGIGNGNDYDKGGNDSSKNNKGTDNPNVEVFTTKRPSTTQRTTTVPDIDIRFRVPEDS